MKTNYALLTAILAIALTLPLFGQHNHADMKKHDVAGMMGKPAVDATVKGLHMKVWLMTQEQHKKVMKENMSHMMMMRGEEGGRVGKMEMKGMKDSSMMMGKDMKGMNRDGMEMDKATRDTMMAGTHYIMLDVTDGTSGKEIDNAGAKVMIVSPSKKNSSVGLKSMMSRFGSGLTFDEKGKYTITVSVTVNGVLTSKEFQYAVK